MKIDPKGQFNALQKEDADAFAKVIAEPFMRRAITYAFAQFAVLAKTPEEITGAKLFLSTFATIADQETKAELPQKNLKTF